MGDAGRRVPHKVLHRACKEKRANTHLPRFGSLSIRLNENNTDIITAKNELHLRRFSTYVAAAILTATLLAMIYVATTESEGQARFQVILVLLGVIASGASLFFGRWIPIQGPVSKP
jgi:hypothetical protein